MPKVRILSGNDAGAVVEMPADEAEAAVVTGFAEVFEEPPPPPPPPPRVEKKSPKARPEVEPKKRG